MKRFSASLNMLPLPIAYPYLSSIPTYRPPLPIAYPYLPSIVYPYLSSPYTTRSLDAVVHVEYLIDGGGCHEASPMYNIRCWVLESRQRTWVSENGEREMIIPSLFTPFSDTPSSLVICLPFCNSQHHLVQYIWFASWYPPPGVG